MVTQRKAWLSEEPDSNTITQTAHVISDYEDEDYKFSPRRTGIPEPNTGRLEAHNSVANTQANQLNAIQHTLNEL